MGKPGDATLRRQIEATQKLVPLWCTIGSLLRIGNRAGRLVRLEPLGRVVVRYESGGEDSVPASWIRPPTMDQRKYAAARAAKKGK